MTKISVHIDGFNLYHAIDNLTKVDPKLNYMKWVNLKGLIKEFAKNPDEEVVHINFYSAFPIHKSAQALSRHKAFVNAQVANGVTFIEGKFKKKTFRGYDKKGKFCEQFTYEEKETDVNVAINIIKDAYENNVDKILLITNDSDISPAIRMAKTIKPSLVINVITPPLANGMPPNRDLMQSAGQFRKTKGKVFRIIRMIKQIHLERNLLPANITTADGSIINRPKEYKPPA